MNLEEFLEASAENYLAKQKLEQQKESYQGYEFYYHYHAEIEFVESLKEKVSLLFIEAVKSVMES